MPGRAVLLAVLAACGHAAPPPPVAPATGAIAGTVRDQDGDPLSFVTVITRGGGRGHSTATDGSGRFRVGDLPPGRYQVTARWGERSVVVDGVPVRAGAVVKLPLELSLAPEAPPMAVVAFHVLLQPRPQQAPVPIASRSVGGIRGRVRDKQTSDLLPGAVVAAETPGLRDAVLSLAGDDGRYRMPALPPGVYTISASYRVIGRGDIEIRRSNVRVVAGEITLIDLDLDAQPQP